MMAYKRFAISMFFTVGMGTLLAQDFSNALEKMSLLLNNTENYHIEVSLMYQDYEGNSVPSDQYQLFKSKNLRMSIIGQKKMMVNDSILLIVNNERKVIRLARVGDYVSIENYLKELGKYKGSFMYDKVKYQSTEKGGKFIIDKPEYNVAKSELVFDFKGFLSKVTYYFESNINGNPYKSLTINYGFSTNIELLGELGLNPEQYLVYKSHNYQLTKQYKNFEFVNLIR